MHENELHPRFAARVRHFAFRRTPDAGAAEDVVQETLRRVIVALRAGRVRDPAAMPSFVLGTASRVCASRARTAARERRALERAAGEAEPAARDDPLGEVLAREAAADVRAALLRLAEADRALLARFFYDGADADEVAAELAITPGAARVRKHRALRRLGEILDPPEERRSRQPRRTPWSTPASRCGSGRRSGWPPRSARP
jgi:RNA polymerase sigma-70 factor (ECF subfamily)